MGDNAFQIRLWGMLMSLSGFCSTFRNNIIIFIQKRPDPLTDELVFHRVLK